MGAARGRIGHVGRERTCSGCRAQSAGNKANAVRIGLRDRIDRPSRALSGSHIDLVSQGLQPVICQRNGLGVKRICLDDISARFEVLAMNSFDHVRLSQAKHVIQPGKILGPGFEALAAMRRFIEPLLMHHRAHRAIDNDDALAQEALKSLNFV